MEPTFLFHVKSRKLWYFWHSLQNTQDMIESELMTRLTEGTRKERRPRTSWPDKITNWTGEEQERSITDESSERQNSMAEYKQVHHCGQPPSSDYGFMTWQILYILHLVSTLCRIKLSFVKFICVDKDKTEKKLLGMCFVRLITDEFTTLADGPRELCFYKVLSVY